MPVQYDRLANRLDERYRHQPFPGIQSRLRRLASCSDTNEVLDVGCGAWHWLSFLSDLPIELAGIDPSFGMLEKARVRVAAAALVCASAEYIPFRASSFDLIFCVNGFRHFSDPGKFLRDSRALLRNGGRLAILVLIRTSALPTGTCTTTLRVCERGTWHDICQLGRSSG